MTDQPLAAGQLRVRVRAAGLNRADLLDARRSAGRPDGRELAGEIVEIGRHVEGWVLGERVMGRGPGFASEAVVPAGEVMRVPGSLSFEEGAALPVALMTMHDALTTNGLLAPGGRVLMHAASSGVGVIGVQLSAMLGAAVVFATSRSAAKLAVLRSHLGDLGCDLIGIDTSVTAFETVATEVDVIVDNVGASVLRGNVAACRVGGRIVQVGRLGGGDAGIDLDELARKRIGLIGVTFRTRTGDDVVEIIRRLLADVGDRLDELRPRIERTYPLSQVETALADLATNSHVGKIVVTA